MHFLTVVSVSLDNSEGGVCTRAIISPSMALPLGVHQHTTRGTFSEVKQAKLTSVFIIVYFFIPVNSRHTFIIFKVLNKEEASWSVFRVKLATVCPHPV